MFAVFLPLLSGVTLAAASAIAGETVATGGGAASESTWLSGRALQSQLAEPVDVNWSSAPLRASLSGLARSQHVAIFLDRRIDPDAKLDLVLHDVALGRALAEIASRQSAAIGQVGPVIYMGPAESVAQLRPLADRHRREAARLGGELARRWTRERAMRWDDLAEPRRLLSELAQEAGLEVVGLEQVPHDLWAAADLPPLALADRLTLIAVQFDLTFQVTDGGRRLRLVPIPDRSPAVKSGGSPLPRSSRAQASGAGREKRYTLRQAKGPLRDLLAKLAPMLQLELRIDEEALAQARIKLDGPVSVSATDATAEELLQTLLDQAGCTFRRTGNVVTVVPKQ